MTRFVYLLDRDLSYPISRPERVILEFSPMSDLLSGDGFNVVDSKQVPRLLAERGLTQEVWLQWVAKLQSEVLPNGPPLGRFGNCLAIVTLLCCPFYYSRLERYHDCVRRWVDEFNAQVLRPLNMFAATQSAYCEIK